MQFNKDGTMFVTASKDHTAKLFDSESLMLLKTYKTERPVNSATISPIYDHVRYFITTNCKLYLLLLNILCILGCIRRWSRCHGCNNNFSKARKI